MQQPTFLMPCFIAISYGPLFHRHIIWPTVSSPYHMEMKHRMSKVPHIKCQNRILGPFTFLNTSTNLCQSSACYLDIRKCLSYALKWHQNKPLSLQKITYSDFFKLLIELLENHCQVYITAFKLFVTANQRYWQGPDLNRFGSNIILIWIFKPLKSFSIITLLNIKFVLFKCITLLLQMHCFCQFKFW